MNDSFEALFHRADAENFEPGEPIYHESEPGSVLFLLLAGDVALEVEGENESLVRAGEVFGEGALFGDDRRSTTARARTPVRALPIGRALHDRLTADDARYAAAVEGARRRPICRAGAAWLLVLALGGATAVAPAPVSAQQSELRNHLILPEGEVADLDSFGEVVVAGDFDGDGFSDLAVGVPSAVVDGDDGAGRVVLHRGGPAGLSPDAWYVVEGFEPSQFVGEALAAGDFDDDGKDELAIGIPFYDLEDPEIFDVGRVEILEHTGGFPPFAATQGWTQDSPGVPGVAEQWDYFGNELVAGNFDGDEYDDLAIGADGERIGDVGTAGAVNVLYGSGGGLVSTGSQVWYRSGGGIDGTATLSAFLGRSLAAGDFDGDGNDDLAVGTESADGEVVVLYGSAGAGIVGEGQQRIERHHVDPGASGWDFAASLAAGDLDASPFCLAFESCSDELVIGMPQATVVTGGGDQHHAGAVYILTRTGSQLDPATAVRLTQASFAGEPGSAPEPSDNFGRALVVARGGGRLAADLAIGSPHEAGAEAADGGAVHFVAGDASGVPGSLWQFHAPRPGIASFPANSGQRLGSSLALADFNGDGHGDLAAGVPRRNLGEVLGAGAVQILYGALFADGFESGGVTNWTNP